jgi:O-antigen/teichoic acid export membrane protein
MSLDVSYSTEGARLTTRVARGSLWSLGGQTTTLLASLVSTPFVIRLLGPEAYGVLALVNVTLVYMACADLGMGVASTRFAAESQARRNPEEENAIIWTSLGIVAMPTLVALALLMVLARPLAIDWLRLPAHLHSDAVTAFRLAALGFAARAFAGVVNTPQLARLQMGVFTLVNTGVNVAQVLIVPLVLLLGGGLVSAVAVIAILGFISLGLNLLVSLRLLPQLKRPVLRAALLGPLIRFGGSMVLISLAGALLFHAEKPLLTRLGSLQEFAFYAVAFLMARIPAAVPGALHQSLLPALSRLQSRDDRTALESLYERAVRGLTIWSLPIVVLLWVYGGPLLTLAAGAEAVPGGLMPLRILLLGTLVDGISYVPRCLLEASGRPHRVALWQLRLLVPYIVLTYFTTSRYGAVGAAAAWSLRAAAESLFVFREARRSTGFKAWAPECRLGLAAAGALSTSVAITALATAPYFLGLLALTAPAGAVYGVIVWKTLLLREEQLWLAHRAPWVARLGLFRSEQAVANGFGRSR